MSLRRFLRGRVEWPCLERVGRELARRSEQRSVRVEFIETDNWLSTPCVVDERWFVKVISPQHSFVHALLTTGRNLGAFSRGTEGFFEHFGTPAEMAEHELVATRRMRELGVNAPEPVETFEVDDHAVLVLEYLPDFRSLNDLSRVEAREQAPALFAALARMHDAGLAHGDLRAENVLVVDGDLYFIDATKVRADAIRDARSYDLACGLAALEPVVGPREATAAASGSASSEELLAAREFLDFVNIRPDHDFDAPAVKGEIEKSAS